MTRQEEVKTVEEFVQSGRVQVMPNVKVYEEVMVHQYLMDNVQPVNFHGGFRKRKLMNDRFGFTTVHLAIISLVIILVGIALYSAIGYVAVHFIKKFW